MVVLGSSAGRSRLKMPSLSITSLHTGECIKDCIAGEADNSKPQEHIAKDDPDNLVTNHESAKATCTTARTHLVGHV